MDIPYVYKEAFCLASSEWYCIDFALPLFPTPCRLEREKAQAVYVARQDLEKKINEAKRELEEVRVRRGWKG